MVFIDTFRELVQVPGLSGYEDRVREDIKKRVEGLGRCFTDPIGNLVLELGGDGPSVLLAAHMDELGLVVTNIEDDGRVRFRKVGGIDDRVLPSQHVIIHSSRGDVGGVIGITPPHIQLDKEPKVIPWSELYIDVGANSSEEVRDMGVEVLDPVTFSKPWTVTGRGRVVATRAVDDRFGCALLVELALRISSGGVRPKHRVYLAWTVQEEVGLRGALALAHRLSVEYMVSVDTVTCCNPVITGALSLGKGPVIRALDNALISSPKLARRILKVARSHGIPLQVASAGGGTDAAAFQRVNVVATALGVAVKYTHSTVELVNLEDVKKLQELLEVVLEEGLKQQTAV